MDTEAEIAELKQQMKRLQDEVTELRASGVRGSKTEAFMALQYDSLPDFYKTPKAITVYKKLNIVGIFVILLSAVALAILIGNQIWHDRESEVMFPHHQDGKLD